MLSFMSDLCESLATGHVIIVSGKTSHSTQKFNISLACGDQTNSDIAMMVYGNLGDDKIVRTSLTNGGWGESEDYGDNPIKRGDEFTIYIMLGDDRFHISIDDESFCTFRYRMDIKQIKNVTVSGDLDAVTQCDHRLVFPLTYPLVSNDIADISYSGIISKNFRPGHVVVVTGSFSGNPSGEFVVLFCENDSTRQLIHFNPRFDSRECVLNTMHGCDDSSWSDREVVSSEFPFDVNQQFKMALAFTANEFKVAVNGRYLMSFSFDNIDLEDEQSLWEILTGFQIKSGLDMNVNISRVSHSIQSSDCSGFEYLSSF